MSTAVWRGGQDTYEDEQEKKVILGALSSFYQYSKVAHYNTTHLRRQSFYALPKKHWELLAKPPFSYLDTLNEVDLAIDKNAEIAQAILKAGLESFGLSDPSLIVTKDGSDWRTSATTNDLEKARSTLRQLFRDWSEEGIVERNAAHRPVHTALQKERSLRSLRSDEKMNVLVPGAGLGRLVFDLCIDGFNAEGNEISYHQLLASSYILNYSVGSRIHTLYPWVHSFSNHKSRKNHLKSVLIPDVSTGDLMTHTKKSGDMSMSASDFLLLYGSKKQQDRFDAVATVFFLDTAPNLIRYIDTVRNCLKTGGLFINVGPLLWHFEGNAPGSHGRDQEEREKGVASERDTGKEKEQENENGKETEKDKGKGKEVDKGKGKEVDKGKGKEVDNGKGKEREQEKDPKPITWGIADPGSVELTDDEVVALVEELGFSIEKRVFGIQAPYIQDSNSMLQNTYRASHWVARKK